MKRGCVLCTVFLLCRFLAQATVPDAVVLRIQNYIKEGNLAAADQAIAAALKESPDDGGLYNLRGIVEANRQDFKAAEADFTKAVRFSPSLTGAYLNLGRVCELLKANDPGALDRAIVRYRDLLKLEPGANTIRLQLAKLLAEEGEYIASLKELDSMAAGVPSGEEQTLLRRSDLRALAAAYERRGQLSEARSRLEQLAEADAANQAPLMELARIAEREQDLKGALAYLAHARSLNPNYAPVHFFFGIVCIELNLPVEAKKSLDQALKLDPENATYNYARGAVELQGRSGWQAIPYFKKFIAARPDDPRGHFALGVAEFASQDYDASSKQMSMIASDKETSAGAEYFLGRIAKADSDWEEASIHFQKSIAADPNYADSHAELGLARMHLNDLAGARKEIDQALALNPTSYIANGNLLTLLQRTKDPLVKSQEQKMRELDLKRSEEQQLMLRTIKVRQYAE